MSINNWTDYISTQASKLASLNIHHASFKAASTPKEDSTFNLGEILKSISKVSGKTGNAVLLSLASPIGTSLKIIHNISVLGGDLLNPTQSIVGLQGGLKQNSVLFPFVFQTTTSMFTQFQMKAPKADKLFDKIQNPGDLSNLQVDNRNNTINIFNYIILPPLFWPAAMQCASSGKMEAEELFFAFSNALNEFITDQQLNPTNVNLAALQQSHFEYIFQYLWAAQHRAAYNIPPLALLPIDESETEFWTWFEMKRKSFVFSTEQRSTITTPNSTTTPLIDLTKDTSSIPISNSNQSNTSESTETKKGFKKLHDSRQRMIHFASTSLEQIENNTPTEISAHCKEFFAASSSTMASDYLIKTIRSKLKYFTFSIDKGPVYSFYAGNFLRSFDEDPCNFTVFNTPRLKMGSKSGIAQSEHEDLLFQQKMTYGRISNEDLKNKLKQSIVVPESIDDMKYAIHNFKGLCVFFFGEEAMVIHELNKLLTHINSNHFIYETLAHEDDTFIAKALFSIDHNIQSWLLECETCENRCDVDDSLINFSSMTSSIKKREFRMTLPHNFYRKSNHQQDSLDPTPATSNKKRNNYHSTTDDPLLEPPASKRVNFEKEPPIQMEENHRIQDWNISKDWLSTFANCKVLDKRPVWAEGKSPDKPIRMCHRWHGKGYCFTNCHNKLSHVPSTSLSKKFKDGFAAFLSAAKKTAQSKNN